MQYNNPVIPGFYPDPSICRVRDDYYLVTSSFEYFPGVPIFHSKDLVHWNQIGHCLTSEQQLSLANAWSSGGIFAPTIRYHDGWFYMTTTNTNGIGNFYVKSLQPGGPWSDPIKVEQSGIDPSLFFDKDGRVYFQSSTTESEGHGIYQCEIDIETGKRLTEARLIWQGTGGAHPEGPHLYKMNGYYYLMIAEGGTEYGHMVTIARSTDPYGPYESCPYNPILSNRSLYSSIHATGHADLVQAHDGSWWAVCLGIRPVSYPKRHHLGREIFLAPVNWTTDGWPLLGNHGRIEPVMNAPQLATVPWAQKAIRDDFNRSDLGLEWIFLRNPKQDSWTLKEHPGYLTLRGNEMTLDDLGSPAFVGRRLCHFTCHIAALLDFEPVNGGDEAGLTVYMNEKYHYDLAITFMNGQKQIVLRRTVGSLRVEKALDYPHGPVILQVEAQPEQFHFSFCQPEAEAVEMGTGESHLLSTEVAGGFTGIIIAMYTTSKSGRATPALFDWYDYEPME